MSEPLENVLEEVLEVEKRHCSSVSEEHAHLPLPQSSLDEATRAKPSSTLDKLGKELDRQTKQTQNLQEKVERATRLTSERMGRLLNDTEMPVTYSSATSRASDSLSEYSFSSQESFLQSIVNEVDVNMAKYVNFPGRDVLEHAIEEYSQQVLDLQRQLRETCEQQEMQKFHLQQTIFQLQSNLHKSQIERDALEDLRMKESREQCELMGQLQQAALEQDSIKHTGEQNLMEADDIAEAKSNCFHCDGTFSPSELQLVPAVEKALHALESENYGLQERLKLIEKQLEDLEKQGQARSESLQKKHKETMEKLITSHDQEMVVLNEKLSASQSNASSLKLQVELLEKQVESQTSQMREMESTLSKLRSELLEKVQTYESKVSGLDALTQAHSKAEQAQRERDLLLQQAEEQDTHLCRLMSELRQTTEDLSVERKEKQQLRERNTSQRATIKSLRQELDQRNLDIQQLESVAHSLKEQCQRLQDAQNNDEAKKLQAALAERQRELQLQQQEAQQACLQLEEVQARVQVLEAEIEVLRMKLQDREKNTEVITKALKALQDEKNSLSKQLEQLILENQQLKFGLHKAEVRLSGMEKEKTEQQAVLSERTQSLHQLTLEKQQGATELEEQRIKLSKLKEEQEVLKEQHSRKTEELQEQNNQLKAQLNNTQTNLEQAASTLRTLEGADRHNLKIAFGMQKEITAKRDQIDFLQSHVKMLEETTEKHAQNKHYQAMERKRLMQEMHFEKENRIRLETELDTLRTNEKILKSKSERLGMALHKMSDSFSECQEFIQKQEQEIMRLKLQHALEVKELQGQNLRVSGNIHRSPIASPTIPENTICQTSFARQTELNICSQRPSSTVELQSLAKELCSVMDEGQNPHASLIARMRSAESHRTRNEQGPLQYTDCNKQEIKNISSPEDKELDMRPALCYGSSSCMAPLGRRSPVHSLLTSDLPTDFCDALKEEISPKTVKISASNHQELTGQTHKELQSKLDGLQNLVEDLQIKNKEMASMIKSQEKRLRRVKERREPLKR